MKKLFYYATILFVIVACTKSEPNDNSANTPIVSSITLDKTSVSFDEFASVEAISFSATVDWVAEIVNTRADGWLSVSPLSGKAGEGSIIIKATENDTPDDRTASIIIKAGTAAKTINVSQKQKDALTVTSSKFEVSAEGGRVSIEVKANIDFNYVIEDSVSDWISYEGTRAIKSSTLVFAVAQNDDIEKREGKITIKSGEFSEEVTIYQAGGEPSIVISKNEQVVSSDGGVVSVEVSSNVDVVVEMPDVDWISENTTRAMSTNTYYFDIQPNDDYDQRSAEIKFINKDNNLSEEVAIIQAQKDAILISDKDVTISDIGGVVEFEVQANVEFEVTDPKVGWIRNITTRGLESHMLRYEIDVNTSYDHRSAEIIVTDLKNRKSEIITITQAQKDAIFVTNDNYTAGREEESIIIEISHNVDYNVDIDCDWIIRSQTRALERDYPTFTILENNTDEIRNGVITFTSNKKDISKTVHIRQRSMACEIHYTSLYGNIIDPTNQNVFGAKMLSNIYEKGKGVITFDDNITAIGYEAFQYRETLRSIVIPNKVTYIDNHAFYGCNRLGDITLPNGITRIGYSAFSGCSIQTINIPKSVIEIGAWAFKDCSNLSSIDIPEGVTSIGTYTFYGCERLQSINLPSTLEYIGAEAFYNCNNLKAIVLPDAITEIESKAFKDCSKLESINIPKGMTTIKEQTFLNCKQLKNVVLLENLEVIENYAFYNCYNLIEVTIPSSVTKIGVDAFAVCNGLKNIYCRAVSPPILYDSFPKYIDCKIYVPQDVVDVYKNANGWKNYADKIVGYDFVE